MLIHNTGDERAARHGVERRDGQDRGQAILRAVVAGERDATVLGRLRNRRVNPVTVCRRI